MFIIATAAAARHLPILSALRTVATSQRLLNGRPSKSKASFCQLSQVVEGFGGKGYRQMKDLTQIVYLFRNTKNLERYDKEEDGKMFYILFFLI